MSQPQHKHTRPLLKYTIYSYVYIFQLIFANLFPVQDLLSIKGIIYCFFHNISSFFSNSLGQGGPFGFGPGPAIFGPGPFGPPPFGGGIEFGPTFRPGFGFGGGGPFGSGDFGGGGPFGGGEFGGGGFAFGPGGPTFDGPPTAEGAGSRPFLLKVFGFN